MVSSWRLSFFSRKKICSQPIKGLERGVATFYDLPGIPHRACQTAQRIGKLHLVSAACSPACPHGADTARRTATLGFLRPSGFDRRPAVQVSIDNFHSRPPDLSCVISAVPACGFSGKNRRRELGIKFRQFPPIAGNNRLMSATKVLWILGSPNQPGNPLGGGAADWTLERLDAAGGIGRLRREDFGVIVLDFPMPGWTPPVLLEQVRALAPGTPVLLRDPSATLNDAVHLARLGVHWFLAPQGDLYSQLAEALEPHHASYAALADAPGMEDWERLLVGDSREMRRVSSLIRLVGARRATVLITGETGTGKELAARALHLAGPRRNLPWVAVNCSALPENLLEAELFGHVRGAFTGAVQSRMGRFEQAKGGTLFLDEIGEMPLELQAKLLRVLQEREFQRLGSSETIRSDARVIAATNGDLLHRIRTR
jgi:hypothetical protein